jgi:hypothetical protein
VKNVGSRSAKRGRSRLGCPEGFGGIIASGCRLRAGMALTTDAGPAPDATRQKEVRLIRCLPGSLPKEVQPAQFRAGFELRGPG